MTVMTVDRHYKQAYGHIMEQRMHDTNMLEIKTIAGFVNYKVNSTLLYNLVVLARKFVWRQL